MFQKHFYPMGLVVNANGERFVDEGADFRNYTYARYGRESLRQPGRVAYQIFDQKTVPLLREEYRIREVTKAEAASLPDLAKKLEINVDGFVKTVESFSAAVQPEEFNPAVLDGKRTRGIVPPKSNGPAAGHAALRRLRRDLRDHIHVRWASNYAARGGSRHGGRGDSRIVRGRRACRRTVLPDLSGWGWPHGWVSVWKVGRPARGGTRCRSPSVDVTPARPGHGVSFVVWRRERESNP